MMLTEICGYISNYFDVKRYSGSISIVDGVVYKDGDEISMEDGQYFALFRKGFALGVYLYGTDTLKNKEFEGSVWLLDFPDAFLSLVEEIEAWQTKYGGVDGYATSPFNSETFGGYSYTKGSVSGNAQNNGAITWQSVYGSRLNQYRKVSLL